MSNDVASSLAAGGAQPWQVRAAEPDDADACAAIAIAAWQRVHDSYQTLLGEELHELLFADWRQKKAREVIQVVQGQPERALVAVAAGVVVGFATFRVDAAGNTGEIGNNAVHVAWQGRGIATTMYQAVLAHMRDRGVHVVRVTTGLDEGHAPARAAYGKAGFQQGVPSITYYLKL